MTQEESTIQYHQNLVKRLETDIQLLTKSAFNQEERITEIEEDNAKLTLSLWKLEEQVKTLLAQPEYAHKWEGSWDPLNNRFSPLTTIGATNNTKGMEESLKRGSSHDMDNLKPYTGTGSVVKAAQEAKRNGPR